MPKPNFKITEREKAVCSRVKEIRESIKWPQPDFARAIGITRDRLANIEGGRTPLRYGLAIKICHAFDVRPGWLASGKAPMRPYISIDWSAEIRIKFKDKDPLTKALDIAGGKFPHILNVNIGKKELMDEVPGDFDFKKYLRFYVNRFCETTAFKDIPSSWKFAEDVHSFIEKQIQEYVAKGMANKYFRDSRLTNKPTLENIEAMSQWQALKRRIRKITSGPGEKTALAKKLGVDITQLSRWLKDSKTAPQPGADSALTMLQWVQEREGQQ